MVLLGCLPYFQEHCPQTPRQPVKLGDQQLSTLMSLTVSSESNFSWTNSSSMLAAERMPLLHAMLYNAVALLQDIFHHTGS